MTLGFPSEIVSVFVLYEYITVFRISLGHSYGHIYAEGLATLLLALLTCLE